jgi:hypothetical protein
MWEGCVFLFLFRYHFISEADGDSVFFFFLNAQDFMNTSLR